MKRNQVKLKKYTLYHPQDNGKVEVINRELERILTKTIQLHRKDWYSGLNELVWAYNIK